MKESNMQVETYEVEEINSSDAATMAADSEAIELAEKMGLKGQIKLTNTTTATRCPYRRITNEEMAVYSTLFPKTTELYQYEDGIIPLRVLKVASHAKDCGYFGKLVVWHPEPGKTDPVLIGIHVEKHPTHSFDVTTEYILARWGDSLQSFEQLQAKAKKVLVERWTAKLKKTQAEIAAVIGNVEAYAQDMVNGGDQKTDPYFNW